MLFKADIIHNQFQANAGLDMIPVRLISKTLSNVRSNPEDTEVANGIL